MKKHKILFVCAGNICRSPAAEAVVRSMAGKAGLSDFLEVDSAGTHAYHEGERPDPRMLRAAARRGYDLGNLRARKLSEMDFRRFDRILGMDLENLDYLRRQCPAEERTGKLGLFLDFAGEAQGEEIHDPYYGKAEGFERVLDLCEAAGRGLIVAMEKSLEKEKAASHDRSCQDAR
jgi:protein-tyrosine phosphatase